MTAIAPLTNMFTVSLIKWHFSGLEQNLESFGPIWIYKALPLIFCCPSIASVWIKKMRHEL